MPSFRSGNSQFGKFQIEFEHEDPVIYKDYADALKKSGVAICQERPNYVTPQS
jgi:hypothetical protein